MHFCEKPFADALAKKEPPSAILPPHRKCALFSPVLLQALPHDADDALFAVNYITGIATPLRPLVSHYQVAHLFFALSPTRLWAHLSEIGHLATTPPTPPLLTSFAPRTSSLAYRLVFVIFTVLKDTQTSTVLDACISFQQSEDPTIESLAWRVT